MRTEAAVHLEQMKRNKGVNFGRFLQALAVGKGNMSASLGYVEGQFGDTPAVSEALAMHFKGAVAPMTGTDATAAGPLVMTSPLASELISLVAPLTLLGRIPFRPTPFLVKLGRVTEGSGAGWVGEGNPIPVSKMGFDSVTLGYNKAGGILVISSELARNSSPQAASVIANDMARATAKFLDQSLVDPGVTAIVGVRPPSITNGSHVIQSSGNSLANVIADLKALCKVFTDAEIPLRESVLIMSERVAIAWASLVNVKSDFDFEDLKVNGGDIWGIPVVTSAFALDSGNSPTEENVVLCHPDSIAVADAGVMVDVASKGAISMDTTPGTPAQLTGLWQGNLIALRAIRYIDYKRRRDAAVACLTGVNL